MKVSQLFVKLTKLCLLSWIVYMGCGAQIREWNRAALEQNITPVFMRAKDGYKSSLSLVIAHPDDEVMFFGPTLLQLDDLLPESVRFNIICLSSGDAENLGATRKEELVHSVNFLFANSVRDVELFQFNYTDGMDVTWNIEDIRNTITNEVLLAQDSENEFLLTFDSYGVSSHLNHKACHEVVQRMLEENDKVSAALYLNSHAGNILVKYSAFVWGLVKILARKVLTRYGEDTFIVPGATLVNTYPKYLASLSTMTNAHQSQLVWFRYGWWFFSRFVFINDLDIVSK